MTNATGLQSDLKFGCSVIKIAWLAGSSQGSSVITHDVNPEPGSVVIEGDPTQTQLTV